MMMMMMMNFTKDNIDVVIKVSADMRREIMLKVDKCAASSP